MFTTIWTEYAALMPMIHREAWTDYLAHLRRMETPPVQVRTFVVPTLPTEVSAVLTLGTDVIAVWQSPGAPNAVLRLRGPGGETRLTSEMTAREDPLNPDDPAYAGYVVGQVDDPKWWVIDGAQPGRALQASEEQLRVWAREHARANSNLWIIILVASVLLIPCLLFLLAELYSALPEPNGTPGTTDFIPIFF